MTSPRARAKLWFAAVAAVMLVVLSWLTATLLSLEHDEREARRQAAVHERLRLALWRMDSWLAPQLAIEATRPARDYRAFPSADNAWTAGFNKIGPNLVLVPSPLLGAESPLFPLRCEVGPDGLTSPQVPVGNERDFAEGNGITAEVLDAAAARRAAFVPYFEAGQIDARVRAAEGALPLLSCNPTVGAVREQQQAVQSMQEYSNRQVAVRNVQGNDSHMPNPATNLARGDESVGPLLPIWLDAPGLQPVLTFARRVRSVDGARLQVVVADWGELSRQMLGQVEDLFVGTGVHLERCERPTPEQQPAMLASVPARLVVDCMPEVAASELPIGGILWATWGVTLLGLAVLGFTVRAAIGFGERRARFASAVTHELRTPLTTFRMYSEMLAEGVVQDPVAQREYLSTLQRESDRLSRVVENVLAWSRLEEGRFASRRECVQVGALLERIAPPLRQRLAEVEMTLEVDDGDCGDLALVTDEEAVGQVLFNLVDNAAKYARSANDKRVTVSVARSGERLRIRVSDRGPGIAPQHRERVFAPFDRGGVPGSSNDVPGVGLGLPLARGLARDLGGDLLLLAGDGGIGACFALELPTGG